MIVKEVNKSEAGLTEVHFRIVVAMLQTDERLVGLVKAYLKWYHQKEVGR